MNIPPNAPMFDNMAVVLGECGHRELNSFLEISENLIGVKPGDFNNRWDEIMRLNMLGLCVNKLDFFRVSRTGSHVFSVTTYSNAG